MRKFLEKNIKSTHHQLGSRNVKWAERILGRKCCFWLENTSGCAVATPPRCNNSRRVDTFFAWWFRTVKFVQVVNSYPQITRTVRIQTFSLSNRLFKEQLFLEFVQVFVKIDEWKFYVCLQRSLVGEWRVSTREQYMARKAWLIQISRPKSSGVRQAFGVPFRSSREQSDNRWLIPGIRCNILVYCLMQAIF